MVGRLPRTQRESRYEKDIILREFVLMPVKNNGGVRGKIARASTDAGHELQEYGRELHDLHHIL